MRHSLQELAEKARTSVAPVRATDAVLPLGIYWDMLNMAEEAGDLTPDDYGSRELRDKAQGVFGFLRTLSNRYGPDHQALFRQFCIYAAHHDIAKPGRFE